MKLNHIFALGTSLVLALGLTTLTSCSKDDDNHTKVEAQRGVLFEMDAPIGIPNTFRSLDASGEARTATPLLYDEANRATGSTEDPQGYPRLATPQEINTHTYFFEQNSDNAFTLVAYSELVWTISKVDTTQEISSLKASCHKNLGVHPASYSGDNITEDRTQTFEFDPTKRYAMIGVTNNGYGTAQKGTGMYYAQAPAPVFYFGSEYYEGEIFETGSYLNDSQSIAPYYFMHTNIQPLKKDHIKIPNVNAIRPATPVFYITIDNQTNRTITKDDLRLSMQGVTTKVAMSVVSRNSSGVNALAPRIYAGQGINDTEEVSLPFNSIKPRENIAIYLPAILTSSNVSTADAQNQVNQVTLQVKPRDPSSGIRVVSGINPNVDAVFREFDRSKMRRLWLNETGRFNLNSIRVDIVPSVSPATP